MALLCVSRLPHQADAPPPASLTQQALQSRQLCLDHDEKLVALLSRVRDVEMRIQRVRLTELNLGTLQDLLRQAAVSGVRFYF